MSVAYFAKNDSVNRYDINKRLTQAEAMFPVSIVNGGTSATNANSARNYLGCDSRIVHYKNTSGTTSQINYSQIGGTLVRLGIYYGANNIQKYIELPPATIGGSQNHLIISMQYMNGTTLLVRTTDLIYDWRSVSVSNQWSGNRFYHFASDGSSSVTVDNVYIYEVVGYYKGSDLY